MASEDERCAHLVRIDRCSLVLEDIGYHGSDGLEVAPDASGEYDPLVPNGSCGDPYA